MNYIISKGYVHQDFHSRHFRYNQFNNYYSHDLVRIKNNESEGFISLEFSELVNSNLIDL